MYFLLVAMITLSLNVHAHLVSTLVTSCKNDQGKEVVYIEGLGFYDSNRMKILGGKAKKPFIIQRNNQKSAEYYSGHNGKRYTIFIPEVGVRKDYETSLVRLDNNEVTKVKCNAYYAVVPFKGKHKKTKIEVNDNDRGRNEEKSSDSSSNQGSNGSGTPQ